MTGDQRTFAIIGAAMEVHCELGAGFLEPVYQEAMALEMERRGIAFRREVQLPIRYKGQQLATYYKADFICYDAVVVELKAIGVITGQEESQVINYLKATGMELDLLVNFGASSIYHKRFANSKGKSKR